jgi:hypothetical protein
VKDLKGTIAEDENDETKYVMPNDKSLFPESKMTGRSTADGYLVLTPEK